MSNELWILKSRKLFKNGVIENIGRSVMFPAAHTNSVFWATRSFCHANIFLLSPAMEPPNHCQTIIQLPHGEIDWVPRVTDSMCWARGISAGYDKSIIWKWKLSFSKVVHPDLQVYSVWNFSNWIQCSHGGPQEHALAGWYFSDVESDTVVRLCNSYHNQIS